MNDEKYVLVCEKCAKDIGITPEELNTAIMLPKPLTDEEIAQEWGKFYPDVFHTHLIDFVRAIEKEHGIL